MPASFFTDTQPEPERRPRLQIAALRDRVLRHPSVNRADRRKIGANLRNHLQYPAKPDRGLALEHPAERGRRPGLLGAMQPTTPADRVLSPEARPT